MLSPKRALFRSALTNANVKARKSKIFYHAFHQKIISRKLIADSLFVQKVKNYNLNGPIYEIKHIFTLFFMIKSESQWVFCLFTTYYEM